MEMNHLYLLIISIITSLVLVVLFFALFGTKKQKTPQEEVKSSLVITSQDIKAIAGDDVMTTQLDLARAYIEMGKKPLAKKILSHVLDHGDALQQQEARELMTDNALS